MEIDTDRIDGTVLALLYLMLHEERRAWKTFDWDSMYRLQAKGFISNPVGKAKSVALTDKGLEESERLFVERLVKREVSFSWQIGWERHGFTWFARIES
jgi:hypothetical protein